MIRRSRLRSRASAGPAHRLRNARARRKRLADPGDRDLRGRHIGMNDVISNMPRLLSVNVASVISEPGAAFPARPIHLIVERPCGGQHTSPASRANTAGATRPSSRAIATPMFGSSASSCWLSRQTALSAGCRPSATTVARSSSAVSGDPVTRPRARGHAGESGVKLELGAEVRVRGVALAHRHAAADRAPRGVSSRAHHASDSR